MEQNAHGGAPTGREGSFAKRRAASQAARGAVPTVTCIRTSQEVHSSCRRRKAVDTRRAPYFRRCGTATNASAHEPILP